MLKKQLNTFTDHIATLFAVLKVLGQRLHYIEYSQIMKIHQQVYEI